MRHSRALLERRRRKRVPAGAPPDSPLKRNTATSPQAVAQARRESLAESAGAPSAPHCSAPYTLSKDLGGVSPINTLDNLTPRVLVLEDPRSRVTRRGYTRP